MKHSKVQANMLSARIRSTLVTLLILYSSASLSQRSLSRGSELQSTQERVLQTNRPLLATGNLSLPESRFFIAATVSAESQKKKPMTGGLLAGHAMGNELYSDLSLTLRHGAPSTSDYGIGVLKKLSPTIPALGSGILIFSTKASVRPYLSLRSNFAVINQTAIIMELKNWMMDKKLSMRWTFALAHQF